MFEWLASLADAAGVTLNGVIWTISLGMLCFFGSIFLVAVLIIYLPATYFLERHRRGFWIDRHPVLRWTAIIVKNLLALVVIAAGAIMLLTPGQGILTILFGVVLLDLPGKRWLERKLISRPSVLRAVNKLRARFHKPPLQIDDPPSPAAPIVRNESRLAATEPAAKSD